MTRNVKSSESKDDYSVAPGVPLDNMDPKPDSTPHPHNTLLPSRAHAGKEQWLSRPRLTPVLVKRPPPFLALLFLAQHPPLLAPPFLAHQPTQLPFLFGKTALLGKPALLGKKAPLGRKTRSKSESKPQTSGRQRKPAPKPAPSSTTATKAAHREVAPATHIRPSTASDEDVINSSDERKMPAVKGKRRVLSEPETQTSQRESRLQLKTAPTSKKSAKTRQETAPAAHIRPSTASDNDVIESGDKDRISAAKGGKSKQQKQPAKTSSKPTKAQVKVIPAIPIRPSTASDEDWDEGSNEENLSEHEEYTSVGSNADNNEDSGSNSEDNTAQMAHQRKEPKPKAKRDNALDDTAAAVHINKWTGILDNGAHALERALGKERSRLQQLPIVFAFVETDANQVQLAHGFEEITLDTDDHNADGRIGFFIGDCITTRIDNVAQQHDPPFCMVTNFGKLTTQYHGKPATATACARATRHLLPGDDKAKRVDVNKIFPVPMLWWSFFLAKARTPTEAYRWITLTGEKTAATTAHEWICAACTQSTEATTSSSVAITVRPAPRDAQVMQWASHSLNLYLPRPKPIPTTNQHQTTVVQPQQPENHSATLHQAMVLAQEVIKSAVERSDRDRTVAKRLPDTLLCRLLGLSRLGWEDQSLLAPVWLTLHQQPDKASKAMVLRTFFQDLGKQVPAFSQFRNSMLFEHITGHKFEPGAGFDTCHHGISLLAVSMRSSQHRNVNARMMMTSNRQPTRPQKPWGNTRLRHRLPSRPQLQSCSNLCGG